MRPLRDELEFERDDDGVAYAEEECENCGGEGRVMIAKMYPSGHTEVWETCEECWGEGYVPVDIIEPTSPWEAFFELRRDE